MREHTTKEKSHKASEIAQKRLQSKAVRHLWLYIGYVLTVSAILCSINTALVYALIRGIEPIVAPYLWGPPMLKYALAVVPVLLVFAQWHAWDLISSRRHRLR